MTTFTKQQTSLALQLAIAEGGLTDENVRIQRTRPFLATTFVNVPTKDIVKVGNEELAVLEAMIDKDFTDNNDGIGVITNDVALSIQKELGIDEAKTGVRLSQNDLEARWGLKVSPQLESTESSNIEKAKIALNVVGFAVALFARKKMADKGMVRSFWYGFPHKPGTFPKNK